MQERERLIEILSRKVHPREGIDPAVAVADYLLDNDIVPVVRCRECKHHRVLLGRDMCAKNAVIIGGSEVGLKATGANDFCSYGEREDRQCD